MSVEFSFNHLEKALIELSQTIRKQDFLTYFKKFSLLEIRDDVVVIGVVSHFHRDNLLKKFDTDIRKTLIGTVA